MDPIAPSSPAQGASTERNLLGWLERYRAGEPRALDGLVTELYPLVRRFVGRLCRRTEHVILEDLVQSSLEQVCRSADDFEARSRFTTFVYGICFRVVHERRRKDRVRSWFRREAEEQLTPDEPSTPEVRVERAERVARAQRILDRIDDESRAAFVMFQIEGLPLEDVATALGCSTRTVRRRVQAAREQILEATRD